MIKKLYLIKRKRRRRYLVETMIRPYYADDLTLLVNIPALTESLFQKLKQEALYFFKTAYIYTKQSGTISTLSCKPLKRVNQFPCFGSNISFTKSDVKTHIDEPWTVIDKVKAQRKLISLIKTYNFFKDFCHVHTTV